MPGIRVGALTALTACVMALAASGADAMTRTTRDAARIQTASDASPLDAVKNSSPFELNQHGTLFGHLPGVQENVELVGELNLISPSTGRPVLQEQIADVAVHKGYAYLNSWDSPTCSDGGTFVVDIRDPANPRQVAFIPADHPFYHGEGAHVVSLDTPQFKGDLLAVNNETYGSNLTLTTPGCAPTDKTGGGFDLYDVTNPAAPVALIKNAGDRSGESSLVQNQPVANSYHSVFVWQDGPRAYLVGVDNTELSDVDILDITNPRNPEFITDLDLLDLPEVAQIVDNSALGNGIFHHDMVVKRIGNQMRMLVSYWDAGYVQLDVNNPRTPTYITDTDFDAPDPLTGLRPPQGNAHQAEYSHDNEYFLAADEEFRPYRSLAEITEAPYAGLSFSHALSTAEPIEPGQLISGDTVFVGFACTGTVPPATPGGPTIAVAERGVCTFQEKADAIDDAGYALGIVFNGSFGGTGRCESLINMLIDPASVDIPMLFVGRANGLRILNAFNAPTYQCTGAVAETPADTDAPAVGTNGLTVRIGSIFDGWGYTHLYDADTSAEIDAYAIPEALDTRYAFDFGDLSVHEFATDPTTNLAYAAYYSGGLRVFRFGPGGLEEVGKFIDDEGSNFWGVEQFTDKDGNRLIAMSDRDFGLQIFKYTGPGAVLARPAPPPPPPPPPPAAVTPPAPPPIVVTPPRPAAPKEALSMFRFGSLSSLIFRNGRASVTLDLPGAGSVSALLRANIGGDAVTIGRASRTARGAGKLRLTFRLSATNARLLRRTLARRPSHRTSGVLRVSFDAKGGIRRTRNRALSIGMR